MFCNGTENAIVNSSITIITKQQQKKREIKNTLILQCPCQAKKKCLTKLPSCLLFLICQRDGILMW